MLPTRFSPIALMAILILAVHVAATRPHAAERPIKVFILAGQSNMEGKGSVRLLEHQIKAPKTKELFAHLHKDGKWVERDDVYIRFLDRKGKLTVGFGSPGRIGPELEFGNTMGDHYDEPVLIIKAAWGGKSLYRDFRPPSSGSPPAEMFQNELDRYRDRDPERTEESVRELYGMFYRKMLDEINGTLTNLGEYFPELEGRNTEIAGFVWFQGWNDMINAEYTAAYTENMAHFIRDVRNDLKVPEMPFVIGVLGVGGVEEKPNPKKKAFQAAQAAAGDLPEFKSNVAVVRTDQYWDREAEAVFKKGWRENLEEWKKVGDDFPYHYLGSVKCFSRIGKGFAEAMIELGKQKQ